MSAEKVPYVSVLIFLKKYLYQPSPMLSAGLEISFNYKSFQLGADLSSAKF